ncbi:TetR/AcrR family transcriptional regulator [Actinokineospora enzanensis]|uniref:TetR/AcrR family transcriptional regulator n=1 Tax=Actinokineospora enzanensis TaxID=155975 RepID=UPI0003779050|nr:TetR/AcrR family transcriptional regulator [Actinokineospora enzanensis]
MSTSTTRDRLIAAAIDQFDRHGYDATSLNALCRRMSMTKGALYRHFPSKQALAAAVVEAFFERLHQVRGEVERHDRGPMAALAALTGRMCRAAAEEPLTRVAVRLLVTTELFDLLASVHVIGVTATVGDLLTQAVLRGELPGSVDPREDAHCIVAAMVGAQTLAVLTADRDHAGKRADTWEHLFNDLTARGRVRAPTVRSGVPVGAGRRGY